MNKDQLTARAKELGIDTDALNAANKKGEATNAELKTAIGNAEAVLHTNSLKQQATDLGLETEQLDTDEKLQEAIDAKNAELAKLEVKTNSNKTEAKEKVAAVYTDPNGVEWFFKDTAPKTLNVDGRSLTQQQILEDESIISEMTFGNSNYLTRKY